MARFALLPSAVLAPLAVSLASVMLGGCPIWSEDYDDDGCTGECCYGECNVDSCNSQQDCDWNEVCGADNQCHLGTCDSWGCPSGSVCLTDIDGNAQCIGGNNSGGAGGGGGGGGGGGAPNEVYCGNPDDCSATEFCAPDGTCQPGDCSLVGCIFGFDCVNNETAFVCLPQSSSACGEEADCLDDGNGYSCLSGVCTPPADQCFDGTQCPSGNVCADGNCVASCGSGELCPASYTCDTDVGLCIIPTQACAITNDCGGPDLVCVEGACVPRADEGACDPGLVWVENGCIPSESPIFVCTVDGEQDACAAGSICLHHSCYISCEVPNENVCTGLPEFDVCKTVTTESGPHDVCGSDQNLGSECDPTAELYCAPGLICVDGFCT